MTPNKVNLSVRQEEGNYAVYLPAISGFYTVQLGKMDKDPNFIGRPMPEGLEDRHHGLDFLKEDAYFNYNYGLYSAGHAQRDVSRADAEEPMVQKRDREKTIVLGDSGGFQIATGVIKLDWSTVRGPGGDKIREQILRWLEHTADWSMTLDVPAFAASPRFSKKTGLTRFEDTLDITEINLQYFMKNRVPGKTKFLNVLSGSTEEDAKIWFDRVIPYSIPECVEAMGYEKERTFEGYAFAGINMRHMPSVLSRILDLRDAGALANKDWIHFLGIGRLDWACYLTSIMRQLQKHDNPKLQISFDAASPFVATAYGLCYSYNTFETNRLTYSMDKAIDNKDLKGSTLRMPYQSPIMDRLVTGDLCPMGPNDPNKQGKIGRTSWDTFSYCLYMAHNVYNHIQSVQEVNRLADVDYVILKDKIDCKNWVKKGGKSKTNELSQRVPSNILFFDNFVAKLLDPKNPDPRQMLADYRMYIEPLSFGSYGQDTFNEFFGGQEMSEKKFDADSSASIQNEDTDKVLSDLDKLLDE